MDTGISGHHLRPASSHRPVSQEWVANYQGKGHCHTPLPATPVAHVVLCVWCCVCGTALHCLTHWYYVHACFDACPHVRRVCVCGPCVCGPCVCAGGEQWDGYFPPPVPRCGAICCQPGLGGLNPCTRLFQLCDTHNTGRKGYGASRKERDMNSTSCLTSCKGV